MHVISLGGRAVLFAVAAGLAFSGAHAQSDGEVRQRIIRESIASYPGSCPCPYSTARNGSRCGGRSAYSRPGGHSPKCYASDVSAGDISAWRARQR